MPTIFGNRHIEREEYEEIEKWKEISESFDEIFRHHIRGQEYWKENKNIYCMWADRLINFVQEQERNKSIWRKLLDSFSKKGL